MSIDTDHPETQIDMSDYATRFPEQFFNANVEAQGAVIGIRMARAHQSGEAFAQALDAPTKEAIEMAVKLAFNAGVILGLSLASVPGEADALKAEVVDHEARIRAELNGGE